MNLPMSDIQIANIIGKVDKDGNNTIDFDEFCARNAIVASKQLFEVMNESDYPLLVCYWYYNYVYFPLTEI